MQTITIEILNDRVLKLLQQLEKLQLLRLPASSPNTTAPKREWAGSISSNTAEDMLNHISKSRSEWDRGI